MVLSRRATSSIIAIGREPGSTGGADGSVERVEVEADNPYACELRDFAAAAAGERSPRLGREDAVGQARAIAALYESAAGGARVVV